MHEFRELVDQRFTIHEDVMTSALTGQMKRLQELGNSINGMALRAGALEEQMKTSNMSSRPSSSSAAPAPSDSKNPSRGAKIPYLLNKRKRIAFQNFSYVCKENGWDIKELSKLLVRTSKSFLWNRNSIRNQRMQLKTSLSLSTVRSLGTRPICSRKISKMAHSACRGEMKTSFGIRLL